MELAFSTLGCPGEDLRSVVERCRRFDIRAVELRSWPGELVDIEQPEAKSSQIGRVLAERGIRVLALASRIRVCAAAADDGMRELDHAAALGADAVRVFPGADVAGPAANARGVKRLATLADAAAGRGIRVLLETHDSHPRGTDVRALLDQVESSEVGAIWDVLHPWRAGETPSQTVAALDGRIGYVQLKDFSIVENRLCLPGSGDVPLPEILEALGPSAEPLSFSLEWERAWDPGLPPLDVALARLRDWLRDLHAFPRE